MRKNQLIKVLKAIPGNPQVVVLDVKKNHESDSGEGTAEGCHGEYEVFLMPREYLPPGNLPWVAIAFMEPGSELEMEIPEQSPRGSYILPENE